MNNIIQIPDPFDDFSVYLDDPKEASEKEWEALAEINLATQRFLNGKMDIAEYSDYLSYYEVDVDNHLKPIDWYLNQYEKLF